MNRDSEMLRLHIFISGRVQGVGFRNFIRTKAEELNLTGWIKNLEDGRVEAVFAGRENKVKEISAAVQTGPSLARVDNVDSKQEEYVDEFDKFRIVF
ncbi:acylphosphatase [Acetohalobium arabaticum]|uniref:acylphosphatase n=1 Tax=Acetohalobium arabaticum (strain ATCC 49924 / DSM 5501 / Z-7288) TaxID=574087 RepID=D9QRQ3_ACEAZ|nr:acylphosphatase [Acetohalobium arabaticum]ADL13194.1 acylphosphatase [Acetohalobium arabaticum DSM 5501]